MLLYICSYIYTGVLYIVNLPIFSWSSMTMTMLFINMLYIIDVTAAARPACVEGAVVIDQITDSKLQQ